MSSAPFLKLTLLLDEVGVHLLVADDVVGDVVEDRQVGLRREDQAVVGQVEAAVLEGRQHVHLARAGWSAGGR
jgi:hypothetical protein